MRFNLLLYVRLGFFFWILLSITLASSALMVGAHTPVRTASSTLGASARGNFPTKILKPAAIALKPNIVFVVKTTHVPLGAGLTVSSSSEDSCLSFLLSLSSSCFFSSAAEGCYMSNSSNIITTIPSLFFCVCACMCVRSAGNAASGLCEPCPAGRFGTAGSANSNCSGLCSAGYWCSARYFHWHVLSLLMLISR